MIKKDYFTVVIQPDWRASREKVAALSSFSIPRRVIYYIFIGTVLLVSFGINGSRTISKNIFLKNKLTSVQESLEQLQSVATRVETMRREERIIRAFLGLEDSDKNSVARERMGQGGAEPTNDIVPQLLNAKQEFEETSDDRPLDEQVNALRENIHGLSTILTKMTKKLNSTPTIMPVKDDEIWITSGFGWRKSPFTGLREFHKGLDISAKKGVPIIVTAEGVIDGAGYDRFLGNYVSVRHDSRFSTFYGHMNNSVVKENQKVARGQVIGYIGSTGVSTGYHLHYEVSDNQRNVNPYNFILNRTEIILASNQNN